jgi:hypothetical protein
MHTHIRPLSDLKLPVPAISAYSSVAILNHRGRVQDNMPGRTGKMYLRTRTVWRQQLELRQLTQTMNSRHFGDNRKQRDLISVMGTFQPLPDLRNPDSRPAQLLHHLLHHARPTQRTKHLVKTSRHNPGTKMAEQSRIRHHTLMFHATTRQDLCRRDSLLSPTTSMHGFRCHLTSYKHRQLTQPERFSARIHCLWIWERTTLPWSHLNSFPS